MQRFTFSNLFINDPVIVENLSKNYTMSSGLDGSSTDGGDEGGPVFWSQTDVPAYDSLYVGAAEYSPTTGGFAFLSSQQYDWACRSHCDIPNMGR